MSNGLSYVLALLARIVVNSTVFARCIEHARNLSDIELFYRNDFFIK